MKLIREEIEKVEVITEGTGKQARLCIQRTIFAGRNCES
jgi:hypothetical protein